jgi:hypothetical protein
VASKVPNNLWLKHRATHQTLLKTLAKGLLTSWVKVMLIGIDMPPVRVAMLISLQRGQGNAECRYEGCTLLKCLGNRIQVGVSCIMYV